ncbi:protein GDAP2 homolog [Dendronephthya gigantea]|uniref:protein GDAP2 homolog n=1 Tax=Dendronephthya gigantea TaxID=151771 RepID=UPI00106BC5BF|nr:protein GDAP2 homolog [Dendronephthya gigantea]
MDPLGAISQVVEGYSLPSWNDLIPPRYPVPSDIRPSKFPVRKDLNKKVSLWDGDITNLGVDAIVNPTNETLDDKNPVSNRIHSVAGPELISVCKKELKVCRTGEAKVTEGLKLPARYVIHTVGPRYNVKYQTAADSALYFCYRNSMFIVREYKLVSIGFPIVYLSKRGFPPEPGAHLAIRTIRRFLEHYGDTIERVVFVVGGTNEDIYRKVMALYFPRNEAEEQFCIGELPENIGNEMGEPVIQEREIRISDKPLNKSRVSDEDVSSIRDTDDNIIESENVGRHAFAHMNGDHDIISHERLQGKSQEEMRIYEQQKVYARWVKRGKSQDFSDLKKLRMIYHCGHDIIGRPVILIIGKRFSDTTIDSDRLVGYACGILDRLVNEEYNLIYFDTMCLAENHPSTSFIKYVYRMIDNKYVKNLKSLHIVHPTFRSKFMTWWFTTFSAPEVKDKVHFLNGVEFLYDFISPEQLDIPQFILDCDGKMNGVNYHTDWKPQANTDL